MENRRKVLIIDDNILQVIKAEKCLENSGYEVTKLASPHGAIAKLDYHHPDLLLIDISMAHLNVHELFHAIGQNSQHEDLVVVLFSDVDAETLQSICVEYDFHGYFCKSIGLGQIASFLDRFYED